MIRLQEIANQAKRESHESYHVIVDNNLPKIDEMTVLQ